MLPVDKKMRDKIVKQEIITSKTRESNTGKMKNSFLSYIFNNLIIVTFVVLFVIFSLTVPYFFTLYNILDGIVGDAVVIILASLGITFVLRGGEFDLSVGGIATLAGMTAALLQREGLSTLLTIPAVLGLGLGLGFFNAVLVIIIGLPSFMATIGSAFIFVGLMLLCNKGYPIMYGMSSSFFFIGQGFIGLIRFSIIIMVAVYFMVHFFLSRSKTGRIITAIGGNPTAVRFAGIKTNLYKSSIFLFCGILAALAGIIRASRVSSGQSWDGWSLVLSAFMAVYIGVGISPEGKATPLGTVIGALFLGIFINGLTLLGVDYYHQLVYKAVILIGVLLVISLKKARNI